MLKISSTQGNNLNGYDLDGTLCEPAPKRNKPFFKQNAEERRNYEEELRNHRLTAKPTLEPEGNYVIITGRNKHETETLQWIKNNQLTPKKVFFMHLSRTRDNMIKYKALIINKLKLKAYYEDDPKIAEQLKKKCPNTKVYHV